MSRSTQSPTTGTAAERTDTPLPGTAAPTRVRLHSDMTVGPVRRRLFGSFIEHMGRCVYTGIHEPSHPAADAQGFRRDVLELVRHLGVTLIRYPGGNFVSGYRWEDGIGPVQERPVRRDLAWHSTEPNTVGLHEFMDWLDLIDAEPMLAVNLGTRGEQQAAELLEYVNGETGTDLADRRIRNGHTEPWDVRLWCLGNEMDGPWQIGHRSAAEYGAVAARTAALLHRADPALDLVACGSSFPSMPTFGSWEREVLEAAGSECSLISAHIYYSEDDGDRTSYLASAVDLERYLDAVCATADHVAATQRRRETTLISLDEWGVARAGDGAVPEPTGEDWPIAPRLAESTFTVVDAVVVGSLLISLLRRTDRVGAACQAQLVNVLGLIRTEPAGPAWLQTIAHPFALTSAHARGQVLRTAASGPTLATAKHGEVERVQTVATWDEDTGALTVLATHRGQDAPAALEVDLSDLDPDLELTEALVITDEDPSATNTADHPDRVVPAPLAGTTLSDGVLHANLPPISWAMLRLHRPGNQDAQRVHP